MFGKSSQGRVNETKAYVLQDVPGSERAAVSQYIDAQVNKMAGGNIKGLSDPMSMKGVPGHGDADERNKRRGLILMAYARSCARSDQQVKTMPSAALRKEYFDSITRLRKLADQECGSGNVLRDDFNKLQVNPIKFLSDYVFFTRGSNTDGLMTQHFFYEFKNGNESYALVSSADPHPIKSLPIQVINVPGQVWSDVTGRGNNSAAGSFATIDGTELNGASLMVTTQFSGCAFCYKNTAGRVFASHIMPGLESVANSDIVGGGKELAKQLAGTSTNPVTPGNFAGGGSGIGNFKVYGSGYSNLPLHATGYDSKNSMILIGLLTGTTWKFYRQLSFGGMVLPPAVEVG